jgi:hypothetical protein
MGDSPRVRRWLVPRVPRSIRRRLTLLYSALFMLAGAALLGFTCLLASQSKPSGTISSIQGPGLPGSAGPTSPDPPTLTTYADGLRADQLHQLLVEAGIALAVMTFASVALGWLMAGRVLAPLRAMTAAARRISADNLRQRLAMPLPTTNSRRWRTPSTTYWRVWRARSRRRSSSSPTPRTSCAPR